MAKDLPNNGYIHPMVCGSCLKMWVDSSGPDLRDDEFITMFGQEVPVRNCPRCIYESGLDWPGTSRV